MRWSTSALVLALAIPAAACTNHTINFDQLPDGTAVQSWTGQTSFSLSDPYVISNQYAPDGVASLSSNGPNRGVMVFADSATSSPPNTVCPIGVAFGPQNFEGPTIIQLSQSTTNVWVSVPVSHDTVTVTALDANNNVLRQEASNGPNATVANGVRRVRVNASGIRRVDLDTSPPGGRYCIDDFTWQERW
jgi:hypothetical protein